MEREIKLKPLPEVVTYITNDPDCRFNGLPMCVEYIDGETWRLEREISYFTDHLGVSTVRAGFKFDFASVPRVLWWLYPPTGTVGNPYGLAALFHDWLCAHRKIAGEAITFKQANGIFLEIMLYLQVRKTLAWTMYLAVSSPFGWWLWKRRKPEDIIP